MSDFIDPATLPEQEREPRHAQLIIEPAKDGQYQVHFNASNGEPLGVSETHPTGQAVGEAQGAWLRAMIEVLEDEGYTVTHEDGS